MKPSPSILVLAGLDPSGGAGLQADIETIASIGGHCLPVMTVNTVQNTCNIDSLAPVDVDFFQAQLAKISTDARIAVIKIGLISDLALATGIVSFLTEHPQIPVVFDPVLASGAGDKLSNQPLIDYLRTQLLPKVHILTPNSLEARRLTGANDNLDQAGLTLLDTGCQYVLITGTHEQSAAVIHRLYYQKQLQDCQSWPRLTGEYHGSGCTLASAIAAYLAKYTDPLRAIHAAQHYTWHTLKHARRHGMGQLIPNRFYPGHNDA